MEVDAIEGDDWVVMMLLSIGAVKVYRCKIPNEANKALNASDPVNVDRSVVGDIYNNPIRTWAINQSDILYINFATAKFRIESESFDVIEEIAKMMDEHADVKVTIEGHTDNIEDTESNLRLSKNRARSVIRTLSDEGIEEERMTGNGYGDAQPIANNSTEKGRSQNRRVEIKEL